jgi:hypothetical protein
MILFATCSKYYKKLDQIFFIFVLGSVWSPNIHTEQNNKGQYKTKQHRTKFKVLNRFCVCRIFGGQKVILVF